MTTKKLHALELSLTIGCKLDCLYCPQKLLLSKYYVGDKTQERQLNYENFVKVLDEVEPGAVISFCGMSEPFHNNRCADMICYAYQKGYRIALLTTLVGMTREDFEKIKDIKFESFVLHIPDAEGHSHFEITDEYLSLLEAVNKSINIDYYSCHGTVSPVVESLIDKKKYAGIELGDRAGNLETAKKELYVSGRIVCYHGSEKQVGGWTPVMLPDGRLVLCCQDYGMKHVLGNLINQTWNEIIEGEEYKKIIRGWDDDSIDTLCRKCGDAKRLEQLPAMKLKTAIDEFRTVGSSDGEELIRKLANAKNVCVFGLGKLFRDHFFQEHWNEGLNVNCFCDNNAELWGKQLQGIKCISIDELKQQSDLIVIVFVKNSKDIVQQLQGYGVKCVTIDEIYEECTRMFNNKLKKMTL